MSLNTMLFICTKDAAADRTSSERKLGAVQAGMYNGFVHDFDRQAA